MATMNVLRARLSLLNKLQERDTKSVFSLFNASHADDVIILVEK